MVMGYEKNAAKGDKSSYDKKITELNRRIEQVRRETVTDIMNAKTYEEAVKAKEKLRQTLDEICEEIKNARKEYKGILLKVRTVPVEKAEEKPLARRKLLRKAELPTPSRQLLYTVGLLGILLASVGVNAYQAFTIASFQRELTDKETIISELVTLTEKQNHTIDVLSRNLTEASDRIIELEEELTDAYSTISSLEKELSEAQALTSNLVDKLKVANETISTLKAKLDELYSTNIVLKRELNKTYEEINLLKERISELNKTIESLYSTFNYNLTAKPNKLIAYPNSSASTTITVEWLGGPSQPVNLTLEWEDGNITAEIAPTSGVPTPEQPLTAGLTVYIKPQASLKTYYITIVAISQYGLEKTEVISIVVQEHEIPPVVG
ncbi:hypothetical protein DRO58_05655 [Candidatus Bathyarchaeota archaeon]|nr:MAG: hypothetical protein DRO58_05655 [Candidatus Bathyarchaeota archaeon]